MKIKTFRLRLTLLYALALMSVCFLFAFALLFKYEGELFSTVDDLLLGEATSTVSKGIVSNEISYNVEVVHRMGEEYYRTINHNGNVLFASLTNASLRWPLNEELMYRAFKGYSTFETVRHGGEEHRILYYPVSADRILRVGRLSGNRGEEVQSRKRLLLVMSPAVLLLSSLISWFLAGIAISPLVKIRTQVEQIRQGRLGKRVTICPKGKEIEELVGVFNDMLEGVQHSIESQKRFTSAVSHEIRSPLTSLRGSMEVALRKKRTPEEYERLLRENLSDVIRLSRITDNLLFLAKADSKLLELRKQWFDLNQLVKNIVERMRYKALSAELIIIEEYQENLELNGDGDLLEQALSNLLDNAIKYTPPGGRITVKTQKKDQTISVAVCDTGIGISEEEIQHIFNRFYRGEKDRVKKIVGTGLGLAIAQWIIHAHEGKILVKSQMNSGSEFLVVFPITSDE